MTLFLIWLCGYNNSFIIYSTILLSFHYRINHKYFFLPITGLTFAQNILILSIPDPYLQLQNPELQDSSQFLHSMQNNGVNRITIRIIVFSYWFIQITEIRSTILSCHVIYIYIYIYIFYPSKFLWTSQQLLTYFNYFNYHHYHLLTYV